MKNFLALIFALLFLIVLEWFIWQPGHLLYIILAVIFLNILSAYLLQRPKLPAGWWKFALLPLTANLIVGAYLSIVSPSWLQWLAAGLTIFNYLYWRWTYFFLNQSPRYISFSLENLSFYVNFILIFLLGSVIYGWRSFLNLPIWLLAVLALIFSGLIIYQNLWVSKANWQKSWLIWLLSWLLLMEIFFVLILLPLHYHLLGFIWASVYYVSQSLINDQINAKLAKSKIKLYLAVLMISWLLILLTARWI